MTKELEALRRLREIMGMHTTPETKQIFADLTAALNATPDDLMLSHCDCAGYDDVHLVERGKVTTAPATPEPCHCGGNCGCQDAEGNDAGPHKWRRRSVLIGGEIRDVDICLSATCQEHNMSTEADASDP